MRSHFKPLNNFFNIHFGHTAISSQSKENDIFTTYYKVLLALQNSDSVLLVPGTLSWDFTYELISYCRKISYISRCPKQLLLFCERVCGLILFIKNEIINYCLHKVDSTFSQSWDRTGSQQREDRWKTKFNSLLTIKSSLIVLIYKQERPCLISIREKEEKKDAKPEIH